jgi:hypothetical protein
VLSFPKAHDKGLCRAKMRREPFALRLGKIRTAKAVSCGFYPSAHGKERESSSSAYRILRDSGPELQRQSASIGILLKAQSVVLVRTSDETI